MKRHFLSAVFLILLLFVAPALTEAKKDYRATKITGDKSVQSLTSRNAAGHKHWQKEENRREPKARAGGIIAARAKSDAKTSVKKIKKSREAEKAENKTETLIKKSKKMASKKQKRPIYKNGDLSGDIVINEIFPHAKKDDRHSEWIELYNSGNRNVNLGNWRLDDEEGGSKPYILPDTALIKAHDFTVIPITQSKLSLGNLHDQVRIFDYRGNLVDKVEYEQAPAGKSYSRVTISKEDHTEEQQWVWDSQISPDKANPQYFEVEGFIKSNAVFSDNYGFPFVTSGGRSIDISFKESLIPGPLAKATFVKDTKARLLISAAGWSSYDSVLNFQPEPFDTQEKNKNTPSIFELKKYEIISDPMLKKPSATLAAAIIGVAIMVGGSAVFIVMKKLKGL